MELSHVPDFETERLLLRKLRPDDLNDMYEYGSDDAVSRFVSWNTHQSMMDTKLFLEDILKQYNEKETYLWGIE